MSPEIKVYDKPLHRLDVAFSDIHSRHGADAVYSLMKSLRDGDPTRHLRAILLGDKMAHPDENPLREIKINAVKEGKDFVEEERKAWEDKETRRRLKLVEIYAPTYDMSVYIDRRLESLLMNKLANEKIIVLEGNDMDRERRTMEAKIYEANERDIHPPLKWQLSSPFYFRNVEFPEFDLFTSASRSALHIRLPYLEGISMARLEAYRLAVVRGLMDPRISRQNVDQIMIGSHTNADKTLRAEKNNWFYGDIYEILRENFKHLFREGKVLHVSGHKHLLPNPYIFDGVWQYSLGFGDSRESVPPSMASLFPNGKQAHLQRSFVYDPFDPLGTIINNDIPIPEPKKT